VHFVGFYNTGIPQFAVQKTQKKCLGVKWVLDDLFFCVCANCAYFMGDYLRRHLIEWRLSSWSFGRLIYPKIIARDFSAITNPLHRAVIDTLENFLWAWEIENYSLWTFTHEVCFVGVWREMHFGMIYMIQSQVFI